MKVPSELMKLPGKHFIRVGKRSKQPIDKGWPTNPLAHNDIILLDHLRMGGNYGVCGGFGLVIVDIDHETLKQLASEKLPETFTVESPGSHGWHLYFLCSLERPIRLRDKDGENIGDIQGLGKMVVGPGSTHPNGYDYKVVKDVPLAQITAEELREAFKPYVIPEREVNRVYGAAKEERSRFNVELDIFDVLPTSQLRRQGREYFGPHPIHGSKTGRNFWVNRSKNVWHCFRHESGGGPLMWLAVEKGIISCPQAQPGALTGDNFKAVLKIAREKGLIKTRLKRPDSGGMGETSQFFTSDDKVNCKALAEWIMDRFTFKTTNPSEQIFVFNPNRGVYEPDGELLIKEQVVESLGDYAKSHYFNETRFIIEAETHFDVREGLLKNEIAVLNGILNVETKELSDFTPDKFITQLIPIFYNTEKECPKIQKFITEVVGKEQVALVQEFLGYCLYKEYCIDKAIMLIGDGANGKSTLLELFSRFLGHRNISSETLQNLCYNRFAAAELFQKLANICADLPDKALSSTGSFKMLTGGDEITAEKKYRDPFTFSNSAKLLFSTNKIPETTDDTIAFFRRWIIISCNNYFPPSKANPHILEDICTPDEMSGLLNWSLEGLERLLRNKRFSDNKELEDYRQQYIRSSNSAEAFIDENLTYVGDPDKYIEKEQLYKLYGIWSEKHRLPTKREAEFTKNLKQLMPKVDMERKRLDGKRKRCWVFLAFKEDSEYKNVNQRNIDDLFN